jgi:Na+-transporting NADH:ubiquinone oxidoreductase subunit A
MANHRIARGLDLPISGNPASDLSASPDVSRVALVAADYPNMRPRLHVAEGDAVQRGTLLFEDRKGEGIRFTAPGAGTVSAIIRGERRTLLSVVIDLNDRERAGTTTDADHLPFVARSGTGAPLGGEELRELLSESGLWTALRARPHDRVPSIGETCASIFVTGIDTHPLGVDIDVAMEGRLDDFHRGLGALKTLTEGPVWLCTPLGTILSDGGIEGIRHETFEGPHPAGLVGTHVHILDPVHRGRTVWHIHAEDVAAVGALVETGRLDVERVISLAGPIVTRPRMIRTRIGACTSELVEGQLNADVEARVISGSVLGGRHASSDALAFLGRYHHQIACIAEDRERVFLGWMGPGNDRFSTVRAFLSGFLPGKRFPMTSTTHGSYRAMVPIGMFERVMPLDILPTFLLRAVAVGDLETAEKLGALELVEEDLSLCSFVSPGKEEFGVHLRNVLDEIWREG